MPRCRECEAKSALINQMRELGKQQAKEIARLDAEMLVMVPDTVFNEERKRACVAEKTIEQIKALVNENGL